MKVLLLRGDTQCLIRYILRLLVYIRVYHMALKRISSVVFASIDYILNRSNVCDRFIS